MPKLDVTYDARVELTMESSLKAEARRVAQERGISTNELIRQGVRIMVDGAKVCECPSIVSETD